MVTTVRPIPPHAAASANARRLVRRLTIRCPVTGRAADTGFDVSAMPRVAGGLQILVDCLECGQDHAWTVNDICLA